MVAPFQARSNGGALFVTGVVFTALVMAHCGDSASSPTPDPCEGTPCEDRNECTIDECDAETGLCRFIELEEGVRCSKGVCWDGTCREVGSVWPCTRAGLESAIEEGGGPFTFACNGPTTIIIDRQLQIDGDVSLDGERNLELRSSGQDRVVHVARGATVELRGFSITGGRPPAGDVAPSFGAGIWNEGGALTLVDSTLYANTADLGGAILNAGTLTIVSSTLSGNAATIAGAAIFDVSGASLRNATIADNEGEAGSAISIGASVSLESTLVDGTCVGEPAFSLGYNVESPGDTCGLDLPSDRDEVSGEDLALGTLSIDIGVLRTHTPERGSVALDAVPPEACATDFDQRGVPRPQGDGCDIGAVERVSDGEE